MAQGRAETQEMHARGQSYLVRIRFRQDNCWQGTIQWLEGRQTLSFRSMLELILLMQEAMEITDAGAGRAQLQSWKAPQTAGTQIAEK